MALIAGTDRDGKPIAKGKQWLILSIIVAAAAAGLLAAHFQWRIVKEVCQAIFLGAFIWFAPLRVGALGLFLGRILCTWWHHPCPTQRLAPLARWVMGLYLAVVGCGYVVALAKDATSHHWHSALLTGVTLATLMYLSWLWYRAERRQARRGRATKPHPVITAPAGPAARG